MPCCVVDLLDCLMGQFGKCRGGNSWKAIPLCLMWIIWREWNNWAFEGIEQTTTELKMIVLKSLFDWMAVTPKYLSFTFFDSNKISYLPIKKKKKSI